MTNCVAGGIYIYIYGELRVQTALVVIPAAVYLLVEVGLFSGSTSICGLRLLSLPPLDLRRCVV